MKRAQTRYKHLIFLYIFFIVALVFAVGTAVSQPDSPNAIVSLPQIRSVSMGYDPAGTPLNVPAIDPAGIAVHPGTGNLFIVDAEIDEVVAVWNSVRKNLFETTPRGEFVRAWNLADGAVYPKLNKEPVGATFCNDGQYLFITNDDPDATMLWVYEPVGDTLALADTVDFIPPPGKDFEGIGCDPATNDLIILDSSERLWIRAAWEKGKGLTIKERVYPHNSSNSRNIPKDPEGVDIDPLSQNYFVISSPDLAIFEFDRTGEFVTKFDLSGLNPKPVAPQGLEFGRSSNGDGRMSLYIADGGVDNNVNPAERDGFIYELAVTRAEEPEPPAEPPAPPAPTSTPPTVTSTPPTEPPLDDTPTTTPPTVTSTPPAEPPVEPPIITPTSTPPVEEPPIVTPTTTPPIEPPITTPTTTPPTPPAPLEIRAAVRTNKKTFLPGEPLIVAADIWSNQPLADRIMDFELYNGGGARVGKEAVRRTLAGSATTTVEWKLPAPTVSGKYVVKLGIFGTDWSPLHLWIDYGASISVSAPPGEAPPAVPGADTITFDRQSYPLGTPIRVRTQLLSDKDIPDVLIDVELYNGNGEKVRQAVIASDMIQGGATNDVVTIPPPSAPGAYLVKVGVFSANWSVLYRWIDQAGIILMSDPAAPPSGPAAITVISPVSGQTVSGVVEIKAAVSGQSVGTYALFWRTGAGAWVPMPTASSLQYKQAFIDFTSWTWRFDQTYAIEFEARDLSGNVIDNETVTVKVPAYNFPPLLGEG